jgi:radical SAM protein with 4Fe4S-binding SPASM domain
MVSETCCDGVDHPRSLLLQWHVTSCCNLRCTHCYQDEYAGDECSLAELLGVLRQFTDLVELRRRSHCSFRGHITVTGGEPFLRLDFFDLLAAFAAQRRLFGFSILTNGTLIDASVARRLRRLRPSFVQVSLDGDRATHDAIRGPGSFEQTVAAVRHLVRERLRTLIAFSAHRGNYRQFPEVARIGRELGVWRVWADRIIPWGNGAALRAQVLTLEETREFFLLMDEARRAARRRWFARTEIAMHRALQFLVAGGPPYRCTAGDRLIAIEPNGDLYPCRRMPIRVGNVRETPLVDLYTQSGLFRALRAPRQSIAGCEGCAYTQSCHGGLRCLAYAMTGDPFTADPGCWHASPRTDQPMC